MNIISPRDLSLSHTVLVTISYVQPSHCRNPSRKLMILSWPGHIEYHLNAIEKWPITVQELTNRSTARAIITRRVHQSEDEQA